MDKDEIKERKTLLALQWYFLKSKALIEEMEKKLNTPEPQRVTKLRRVK